MRWTRCVGCSTGLLRWHLETGCPLNRNLQVESAVVRIRTADHPINSRGLYRTELRRPGPPYKRGTQIVSSAENEGTNTFTASRDRTLRGPAAGSSRCFVEPRRPPTTRVLR